MQLVALERLPSIEGAAEILMDITFSRGLCRGGALKSPPNREFSSRFGKEEMSTEDKRRRLRRFVPPWSFLTRQRFLLEKQKKMLKGSHKPVQCISLLIDFRFPLLQSKFLPSTPQSAFG
ncbi:MAG: hypothetical protein V8S99_07865 [Oscillospiraceae bacterium]